LFGLSVFLLDGAKLFAKAHSQWDMHVWYSIFAFAAPFAIAFIFVHFALHPNGSLVLSSLFCLFFSLLRMRL
jgi:hypothetical protein